MRYDWLLTGAVIFVALLSLQLLVRDISGRLAQHWRRFLARPLWFRVCAGSALMWIALKLLRAGPRPFLAYLMVVGGTLLWAAAAARSHRS